MQSSPPDTRSRVDHHQTLRQALRRSHNPNPTLSRYYRKIQSTTPCRTHIHVTPMAQMRVTYSCLHFYLAGKPLDAPPHTGRNRCLKDFRVHTLPRWTGHTMVFSPRDRGGHHFPNRVHEVPRTFSPRSAQTRIAPTILLHLSRTARNSRAVHDPVPGYLQTSSRRCLSTPYIRHFPVQFTRASPHDSRTYKLCQPNY